VFVKTKKIADLNSALSFVNRIKIKNAAVFVINFCFLRSLNRFVSESYALKSIVLLSSILFF